MAGKVEIVIQKDANSPSSGKKDGQLRSTRSKQGETGSSQLPVLSAEDASVLPSDRSAEWLRSIKTNKPEETEKSSQLQRPKMPMVPSMFREIKENMAYYVPSVVSIGPYHHGDFRLEKMQRLKDAMAKEFSVASGKTIEFLFDKVAEVAEDVRKYYIRDKIKDFDDKAFTEMMFLDGCFILQFINCFLYKSENLKMTRHDAALVVRDLFLLENQLPFPVLKSLMNDLRFEQKKECMEMMKDFLRYSIRELLPQLDSFMQILEKFLLKKIWLQAQPSSEVSRAEEHSNAAHLLEHFRALIIEEADPVDYAHRTTCWHPFRPSRTNRWYRYRPAMELKRVGIDFRPSRTSFFTDVTFEPTLFGGTLELPPIRIDRSTKFRFLNLVAYESYFDASDQRKVTSYICFMDSLIDTAEDVSELRSKGILFSYLGHDEEVAKLFNELADSLEPNPHAYGKVKMDIESYYGSTVKKILVDWWRFFFSSPWHSFAYAGALWLIILASIQTYLAVFPPKGR